MMKQPPEKPKLRIVPAWKLSPKLRQMIRQHSTLKKYLSEMKETLSKAREVQGNGEKDNPLKG